MLLYSIDGAGNVPRDTNHTASVHVINRMGNALSCLRGCTHSEVRKVKEAISGQWAAENRLEDFDEDAREDRANKTQTVLRELAALQKKTNGKWTAYTSVPGDHSNH